MDVADRQRLATLYDARVVAADEDVPGYRARWLHLRWQLLRFGGELVVPPIKPDEFLPILAEAGWLFPTVRRAVRGRMGACHRNATRLWVRGEVANIGTGYALSDDGLWRQHSWGVTRDEDVVETTEPRLRYYGVALGGSDALEFATTNAEDIVERTMHSDGWRAERLRRIVDAYLDDGSDED